MISNEERHEVAARLRDIDLSNCYGSLDEMCAIIETACGCDVGQDWQDMELKDRLADLIDPEPERTCKIDGTYDDEFGIYDHLSCGHVAMRQWPEKTNYCPNCGAKVVEVV